MRALLFLILIGASAGCLRKTEFKCQTAEQCTGGGTCEPIGYCSYADSTCTDGRRYGEFSGSLSNECVGGELPMVDADITPGDGGDGGMMTGNCPSGYNTLSGAGTHRYKVLSTAANWTTHRDACAADGSNAYLAIPDDQAELQALTTAAAADAWVGINDMTTENTFVTVKGANATYLPWAANEPDDGMGGQDCVTALMASPNIQTDKCTDMAPAVCECDP
jgi:hypothetical protein